MSFVMKQDPEARNQAGFVALEALKRPWVERFMVFGGRTIPVVFTRLLPSDRWGGILARWGVGRMNYSVLPGLYAVGKPGPDSMVFVSANYKLSFDALRSKLGGLDAWILVLDTKGINVWCAAGKGSFGTVELVSRIAKVKLGSIVTHRKLVLPQLGASGVSAPEVVRRSGFSVEWGPVRASDIPAWLAAGRVKSEAMGEVTFTLRERMAVAPVELVHAWPMLPAALALGALYGLPAGTGWFGRALPAALLLAGTMPVGTLLFPALLPWLPGRAFVVKGAILGAAWAVVASLGFGLPVAAALGGILVATPVTAFFGMNFTGASTYTSQPGALLEVERSFWPMIVSLVAGFAAAGASRLFGF
jgi:hypothetical protein